jgi:hypothetical protein
MSEANGVCPVNTVNGRGKYLFLKHGGDFKGNSGLFMSAKPKDDQKNISTV